MHSDRYTLFFAMAITVVASILLASAATLLKPLQDRNEALDRKKNILIAAGLLSGEELRNSTSDMIEGLYKDNIREKVIDSNGDMQKNITVGDLDPRKTPDLMAIYLNNQGGKLQGVIIPISGKGLWSTIYGYIALDPDFNTVGGVTFYKHGETPGLGGEIEKPAFTDDWKGKKIFEDGELVSITVAKGKVREENDHMVDGVSGSTLTGKGINDFLKRDLTRYLPYIEKHREEL